MQAFVHPKFHKFICLRIFYINMSSDRPCQELLNACFSFEISNCRLKLQPLKTCLKMPQFKKNFKAI